VAHLFKFTRFCFVGVLGTTVDFSVLFLLFEFFNLNLNLAIIVAFLVATINNFYLNKKWTFKNRQPNLINQYLKFLLVSIIGVFLNIVIINSLIYFYDMWYVYGKIIATIFVLFINFFANYTWTFADDRQ
jgi:putative flippase GtrA